MGNDVLTRALKELGKEALSQADCVYREVLLTVPTSTQSCSRRRFCQRS